MLRLANYVKDWEAVPFNPGQKMGWLVSLKARSEMQQVVRFFGLPDVVTRRVQMALFVDEFPEEMLYLEYNEHDRILNDEVKAGVASLRQVLARDDATSPELIDVLKKISSAFEDWRMSKSVIADARKAILCLHMEKQNGADNEDKAQKLITLAVKTRCMSEEEGWGIYHHGVEGIDTRGETGTDTRSEMGTDSRK